MNVGLPSSVTTCSLSTANRLLRSSQPPSVCRNPSTLADSTSYTSLTELYKSLYKRRLVQVSELYCTRIIVQTCTRVVAICTRLVHESYKSRAIVQVLYKSCTPVLHLYGNRSLEVQTALKTASKSGRTNCSLVVNGLSFGTRSFNTHQEPATGLQFQIAVLLLLVTKFLHGFYTMFCGTSGIVTNAWTIYWSSVQVRDFSC